MAVGTAWCRMALTVMLRGDGCCLAQGVWTFDTLQDGSILTYYLSAYYYRCGTCAGVLLTHGVLPPVCAFCWGDIYWYSYRCGPYDDETSAHEYHYNGVISVHGHLWKGPLLGTIWSVQGTTTGWADTPRGITRDGVIIRGAKAASISPPCSRIKMVGPFVR